MSISSRIQSITNHLEKDWNSVESLGADTSVDKNIENIAAALDGVYEELPKVTGEGTSISLSPTKKGGIKLDLKGNTSQVQTTQSKNLLPNTATTQTINDLTFTVNNDKSISISGTPTATTTLSINTSNIKLPAGTYTMSTHKEGTTSGNAYINVRLADESANVATINLHIASSSTFTLEQETTLYVRVYSSSNITFTDFKIYPMIESGETVTDYVEFVPNSPSPDYPQDIHVVKGNNTITISNSDNTQSQSYQITLGSSTNTFDITKVIEGSYNDNSQYNSKRLTLFGELKSNGYVVDVVCNNSNLQFGILRTSMNTISSSNQNLQSSGWYPNYCSLEFNGEGYVCILIKKADDSDITINDISSNDFNISQSYELCKLGDYQDYIYKTNGNWYFHKNILKVCINGENWVTQADYVFYKRFIYITNIATSKIQTYCNQFIWDNRGSGMTSLADNHFAQQSNTALYVRDNRNQNRSTFETWLNANPLIVYFRLTTPTDTQITDSTLIAQLEALKKSHSYDLQTNVTQTNDDLPFELTASALLDVNTQIEHLEAQIEALS